jgi:hypothetical protein
MTGFAIAAMRRTSSKLGTGAERLASEPTANSVSRVLAPALGLGRICGLAGPEIASEERSRGQVLQRRTNEGKT